MEEYNIKLRLTQTEAERLVKAAAHHDQKVSELLESFVYDLVASDEHRGGDDETDLAHQWYQRRNEALYPHHATPLTESESLKLAKTDTLYTGSLPVYSPLLRLDKSNDERGWSDHGKSGS